MKDIFIHQAFSVKDVLKKLNRTAEKVLLVVDNNRKLLGTITDGDIRRYILQGKSIENNIKNVYNKNSVFLKQGYFTLDLTKEMFIKHRVELLPVVNEKNEVTDFITWNQAFSKDKAETFEQTKINIPVVIMAGGKGTRLEPFTKIFPKALVPIGDRTIIETIIEEFKKQGVKKYYLTLNHRGEMIESYFNSMEKDYEIIYIKENDFLGTAGSLKLLEEKINNVFIVTNCDVIVKANFADVISLHKGQNASLTILSSIQHYKIPYGIIKFKEQGRVISIYEKPEYTFTINTGVYVIAKDSLQFIPQRSNFDMDDLINNLIKNNKKVIIYPVNENDYIDIGQWEEYKKAIDKLKILA